MVKKKTETIPMFYNKHYIRINDNNHIIDGFSDAFRQPTETDICINEQGSYQFRLIIGGEFGELTDENPPLFEGMGAIPLYEWNGSEVVRRAESDLEADRLAEQKRMEKAREEAERNSPQNRINELERTICEMDIANSEWQDEIENALCEMDKEE